jgi:hypothetical protein
MDDGCRPMTDASIIEILRAIPEERLENWWERNFVRNVLPGQLAAGQPLTDRQRQKLEEIASRC